MTKNVFPPVHPEHCYSPENELLLVCARVDLDSDQEERIKALVGEKLNWNSILQQASRHGLTPLLYHHLNAVCARLVPQPTLERLRREFHQNAGSNLFLAAELVRLLQLFERHEIAALPFKGPVLAVSVYGNLALRSFGDLDILVRREDMLRAHALLVLRGYHPKFRMSRAQQAKFLQIHPVHPLVHDGIGVTVELHWQLTPRFFLGFDPEHLWQNRSTIPLGGVPVPTLSPEDLLLSLCAHGAKHLWQGLEWICGVAELIRSRPELDWKQIAARAHSLGSERILHLGVLLARDLLRAPVPRKALQVMRDDTRTGSLAAQVGEQLFEERDGFGGYFARSAFHLRVRERFRDRASYCFRLVSRPTPEDGSLFSLPASLFFLYYLIRPIRVAVRLASLLVRGSRHQPAPYVGQADRV